tara:strand:+ start:88 stop:498 length:411 start_codon:yes stop_codon:yes gene_type:complete
MSEKNDEKTNGNVIKGPWTPKEIVSENELDATKALKLAFAEALTQQIVVQLIYTMGQNDVDVADNDFVYDIGLIIELTKGCIYRSIGLPHPTHLLTEVLKSLPTDHQGKKYSEDHIAEVLEMLESMEEDDDEPEFE